MVCVRGVIFCVLEPIKFHIEILTFLVSSLARLGPGGREVIFSVWEPIRLPIEILTFLVSNLAHLGPCGREVVFSVWKPIRLPIEILTVLVSNLAHLDPHCLSPWLSTSYSSISWSRTICRARVMLQRSCLCSQCMQIADTLHPTSRCPVTRAWPRTGIGIRPGTGAGSWPRSGHVSSIFILISNTIFRMLSKSNQLA